MHDDNPLWYDYAEPDEADSAVMLALAVLVGLLLAAATATVWVYWLPDRLYHWLVDETTRRNGPGARRG
ncbi:hypothetical protein [Methylobacterium sp. GC_Met_2]|uniref:hypothetical protein n=1 Tax=Methylobacterium sp. GC_Met_2 TaxID=2937376 RepID=UPI00226B3934|nr:hypothetical protein [Methylobacterium sp. GC_Met_2]